MYCKSLLFLALSLAAVTVLMPPARAADLQQYERKYISLYPLNEAQFNVALMQKLKAELPRFGYQDPVVPDGVGLGDFVGQVYAYQQAHAGELAANREIPDLRFGDKLVSWAETQRIMQAAFVIVPQWNFGKPELKNLHAQGNNWFVDLASPLTLQLQVYRIDAGQAVPYATVSEQWDVSQEYPIDNFESILAGLREAGGVVADPSNPLIQPLILNLLNKTSPFQELLSSDPAPLLQAAASKELGEASFASLIKSLKQLGEFSLSNQIAETDPGQDRAIVRLAAGETVQSLGAKLDQGFRIVEYQRSNGVERPVDVGFLRVRERQQNEFRLQPIIALREPELGDQLIEYPQIGAQVELMGGTAALGLEGQGQNLFAPQAGLRLQYSLANAFNVSELYGSLSGSTSLPLGTSGTTGLSGEAVGPDALAQPLTLELGLHKRWYLRQLSLELGLQGGILSGFLLNAGDKLKNLPTSFSPGLTLLGGAGWQLNPDLALGLQAGWRFYLPQPWKSTTDFGPTNVAFPSLMSNGPILQLQGSYSF